VYTKHHCIHVLAGLVWHTVAYYLEAVAATEKSLLEAGPSSPTPGTCAVLFAVAASSSMACVTCAVSSEICFEPLLAAV